MNNIRILTIDNL